MLSLWFHVVWSLRTFMQKKYTSGLLIFSAIVATFKPAYIKTIRRESYCLNVIIPKEMLLCVRPASEKNCCNKNGRFNRKYLYLLATYHILFPTYIAGTRSTYCRLEEIFPCIYCRRWQYVPEFAAYIVAKVCKTVLNQIFG